MEAIMTKYNVHIYREMRLTFEGIEADSPEEAAHLARELSTEQAVSIDDCDGENLAALVDVVGDEHYENSRTFEFQGECARAKAATPEKEEATV
jgi:hypothetical protein